MHFIQQWNHPYYIYLLIPLMLGMIAYVYKGIWHRLRASRVSMLDPDYVRPNLKKFILAFVIASVSAVLLISAILVLLPKTLSIVSFLLVFILEIIIAVLFKRTAYGYVKKYIHEDVARNARNFTVKPDRLYLRILPWAYISIIALLILAIMGPEGGEKQTMLKRTPLKITVAFDLSRSMDAADFEPSRLTAAKDEVRMLLSKSHGDEIGLVLFSDTAVVQSPQTQDIQTLLTFLSMADTDTLPTHGTDLNEALVASMQTFDEEDDFYYQDAKPKTRRVVLVTDGETHTGDLDSTLALYRERHIHVDVLAIGTENGAEIKDKSGTPIQYQRETVISRLQTEILKDIAQKTDGSFVKCTTPEMAAQHIISVWDSIRIDTKPKGFISSLYRVQLYRYFLYPAYAILLLLMLFPISKVFLGFTRTHCKPGPPPNKMPGHSSEEAAHE